MQDQQNQYSEDFQIEDDLSYSSNPSLKEKAITKQKQGRGRPRKFKKIDFCQIKYPHEVDKNVLLMGFNIQNNQNLLQDIVDELQFNLIDFFTEINQEKGFVYGAQCRKKFGKLKKVRWSQIPQWHLQKEKQKIQKICQSFGIQHNKKLQAVLLEASSLLAEEFTGQFYNILLQIYSIITQIRHQPQQSFQKQQNKLTQLAKDVFQNKNDEYYLFSLTFRAEVKASKKMPFSRLTSPSAYNKLITKISQQLKRLNYL